MLGRAPFTIVTAVAVLVALVLNQTDILTDIRAAGTLQESFRAKITVIRDTCGNIRAHFAAMKKTLDIRPKTDIDSGLDSRPRPCIPCEYNRTLCSNYCC